MIRRFQVFAVEDTSAQLCWAALDEPLDLRTGGNRAPIRCPIASSSPGSAVIEGLEPGQSYEVFAGDRRVARFRTLVPPPGRELGRFATISDIHLGERHFGAVWKMVEPGQPAVGYTSRCAIAAVDEALAWGATTIVVKGDLTYSCRARQFELVAEALAGAPRPVPVLLGNHDVRPWGDHGVGILEAAGLDVAVEPAAFDLPGIRVVLVPTAVPGHKGGRVPPDTTAMVAKLAGEVDAPVFVALHHPPQRFDRSLGYPPGVPAAESDALLAAVAAANPRAFVSAGHIHRNRMWTGRGLPVTTVASTKDYPGVWGGYVVHEGGIRQVVRRVAEPSAMAWTERSGRALGGLWRWWSPGLRSHRCFSHAWPLT